MTVAAAPTIAAHCACGSGLAADRCCALDWASAPTSAASLREVEAARSRLASGDVAGGEGMLLALLGAHPLDLAALRLLRDLRASQGASGAADALNARIVGLDPNDVVATQALALALFSRGALGEAEHHARNAVRLAPTDVQSHNLMGMILTEAQRPQVGEHHYRRALELLDDPAPILLANLAWNLKNQGRMAEARAFYEQSVALEPNIFQTVYGWARMEETDRNFDRAGELLDAAETLAPGNPSVMLSRAVLHGRRRDYDAAIATLDEIERQRGGVGSSRVDLQACKLEYSIVSPK